MNKIKVRQYTAPQLKFYDSENNFIGFINNKEEMLRARVDVANNNESGYYFTYGNTKIDILNNGEVVNFPTDLYDESLNNCFILRKYQK